MPDHLLVICKNMLARKVKRETMLGLDKRNWKMRIASRCWYDMCFCIPLKRYANFISY